MHSSAGKDLSLSLSPAGNFSISSDRDFILAGNAISNNKIGTFDAFRFLRLIRNLSSSIAPNCRMVSCRNHDTIMMGSVICSDHCRF